MNIADITVTVINNNLAIALEPVPGFGKLGTVTVRTPGKDNKHVPIFYSGGFFKRPSNLEQIPVINNEIMLLANLNSKGKAIRVNYTHSIRAQLERLRLSPSDRYPTTSTGSLLDE